MLEPVGDRSRLVRIPNSYLLCRSVDSGFSPSVGVYIRSYVVVQSTSRTVWMQAIVFVMLSVPVFLLVPLPIEARIGCAMIPFMGAVGLAVGVPTIRSLFGVDLIADKTRRVVEVKSRYDECKLPWDSIIALQLLQSSPHARPKRPFQLNLVYWGDDGEVKRLNLYASEVGWHVRRIASRYEILTGWRLERNFYDEDTDRE